MVKRLVDGINAFPARTTVKPRSPTKGSLHQVKKHADHVEHHGRGFRYSHQASPGHIGDLLNHASPDQGHPGSHLRHHTTVPNDHHIRHHGRAPHGPPHRVAHHEDSICHEPCGPEFKRKVLLVLNTNVDEYWKIEEAAFSNVDIFLVNYKKWSIQDYLVKLKEKFGNASRHYDEVILIEHGDHEHFQFLKQEDDCSHGIPLCDMDKHPNLLRVLEELRKHIKPDGSLVVEACCFASGAHGQHVLKFLSRRLKVKMFASTHANGNGSGANWCLDYGVDGETVLDMRRDDLWKSLGVQGSFDMEMLKQWGHQLGGDHYHHGHHIHVHC